MVELTACFESMIQKASERKTHRYASLQADVENSGHLCDLVTIEIGSRGLVSKENKDKLSEIYSSLLKCEKKKVTILKNKLSKTAVLASYVIFYSKYSKEWIDPPLIE